MRLSKRGPTARARESAHTGDARGPGGSIGSEAPGRARGGRANRTAGSDGAQSGVVVPAVVVVELVVVRGGPEPRTTGRGTRTEHNGGDGRANVEAGQQDAGDLEGGQRREVDVRGRDRTGHTDSGRPLDVDVPQAFADPDGDALTYAV